MMSLPATAVIGCETFIVAFDEAEQPAMFVTVILIVPELPVPQFTLTAFPFEGPMKVPPFTVQV